MPQALPTLPRVVRFVPDSGLFRLRVVFQKAGRLSLLSHLEVARALERAVRRARLPFAVSNGFAPHMRVAFGAALPVGVGGLEEFFDLFLESYLSPDKALNALQSASVEGLFPLRCYYVETDAPSASSAFPLSTYEASLSCDVPYLLVPETVKVTRKKKEKVLRVEEFLVGAVECDTEDGHKTRKCKADERTMYGETADRRMKEGCTVRFTLEAKQTGSLRPDAFLNACLADTIAVSDAPADTQVLSMMRIQQRNASGDTV